MFSINWWAAPFPYALVVAGELYVQRVQLLGSGPVSLSSLAVFAVDFKLAINFSPAQQVFKDTQATCI